jgi:guanylate kinase
VSYTTRPPRPGEVEGKDYHFVSNEEFMRMANAQEFAEWAVVHGNRYGTAIATVNRAIEEGVDCLFDIDYQGGRQIRQRWPNDSVLCFILPPSIAELERRLRQRATDSDETIALRLAVAHKELFHYADYDYLVVNDRLGEAYDELRSIYVAARCARFRNEPQAQALLAEAAARFG